MDGLDQMCRGCTYRSNENHSLFSKPSGSESDRLQPTPVARMLAECLAVKIHFGDGYPTSICKYCEQQLSSFAEFKSSVLRIHRHYTRHLEKKRDSSNPPKDHKSFRMNIATKESSNNLNVLGETEQQQLIHEDLFEIVDPLAGDVKNNSDHQSSMNLKIERLDECESNIDQLTFPFNVNETTESKETDRNTNQIDNVKEEPLHDDESSSGRSANISQSKSTRVKSKVRRFPKKLSKSNRKKLKRDFHNDKDGKPELEYLAEMPEEEVPLEDGMVVDNRYSLPKPVKMTNGLRCSFCKRGFMLRSFFEMHLCKKGGQSIFQCTTCEEPLKANQIRSHLSTVPNCLARDESQYLTKMPNDTVPMDDYDGANNRHAFRKTVKVGNVLRCSVCKRGFRTNLYFDMHVCSMDGLPVFQCPDCEIPLNYSQMLGHLKESATCSKSSSNTINTNADIKKHLGICSVCQMRFTTENGLKYHVCSSDKIRRFKCDICNRVSATLRLLEEHLVRHTEIRAFACELCPKTFKVRADLYVHRQGHFKSLRKYICDMCGHASRNKSHLLSHIVTHNEHRPFKCGHCVKSFKSEDMYQRHFVSLHSKDKPFVCDMCGAAFGLKNRLQRHVRNHQEKQRHAEKETGDAVEEPMNM